MLRVKRARHIHPGLGRTSASRERERRERESLVGKTGKSEMKEWLNICLMEKSLRYRERKDIERGLCTCTAVWRSEEDA